MIRMKRAANKVSALLLLLTAACAAGMMDMNISEGQANCEICDTPVCMERAKMIMMSLDQCVDPCEDFFSYACGGWIKKNPIPKGRKSYSHLEEYRNQRDEELKRIIMDMTVHEDDDQKATDKLAMTFKACLAVPEAGDQLELMKMIMKDAGLADWPLLAEKKERQAMDMKWSDMLMKVGLKPILDVTVTGDRMDISHHIIQLNQITFGTIGREQLVNPNARSSEPIITAYKMLIAATAKFINPDITEMQAKLLANDLVEFQGKWANLTAFPGRSEMQRKTIGDIEKESPGFTDSPGRSEKHRKTIGDIQKEFPDFPLLYLLNKAFNMVNMTLDEGEMIQIAEMDYFKAVIALLKVAEPMTLFNYFGMKIMLTWSLHASKDVRNAYMKLTKAASGLQEDVPRWKKCIRHLNDEMKEVTGYIYVKENFNKETKMEVEKLLENFREVYKETLEQSEWMDDETREKAKMKLKKLKTKVGYPEWLMDPTMLDDLFKDVPKIDRSTHFFKIWRSIKKNNWKRMLKKLRMPYESDKIWLISASHVVYFTGETMNDMVFPAGYLQGVFYEHGLPRSINIGSLGIVATHEFTHLFDNRGGEYDGDGRQIPWRSNSTREKFNQKAECFRQQYRKIYDRQSRMLLNPNFTLTEDLADNAGFRKGFQAYKKSTKEESKGKDTRLKGIEDLSPDKLFFISGAMVRCESYLTEELRERIPYHRHSPAKYRVNVPLKNMMEFGRVFNCPEGSPMNPKEKERCVLW